jgi:two-component system, chemotaxis family, sensor kinase CheA
MHTIKGSGAMFGFDAIAAFTHEVETVFDLVRNGKMVVTKELFDLTLKSRDHISALLDASAGWVEADKNAWAMPSSPDCACLSSQAKGPAPRPARRRRSQEPTSQCEAARRDKG